MALNAERAAEEKKGLIRWLRPEFQNPEKAAVPPKQADIEIEDEPETKPAAKGGKQPWPKELPDQVRQVADVLASPFPSMRFPHISPAKVPGSGACRRLSTPWKPSAGLEGSETG